MESAATYLITNIDNVFDGWGNEYAALYDSASAAIMGDGLEMRLTRNGADILWKAYLDGAWKQFCVNATCDANAATDIRLLVCAGSWEFSNITLTDNTVA